MLLDKIILGLGVGGLRGLVLLHLDGVLGEYGLLVALRYKVRRLSIMVG